MHLKNVVTLFMLLTCASNAFSHISETDVHVNVTGLSNEYAQKFDKESSINRFVYVWNQLVEYDVSSVTINVSYHNNQGWINVSIPYSAITHFNSSKYSSHNSQFVNMGANGISVLLEHDILSAISEYKFDVARDGWTIDNRIMGFTNAVTLVKSNGDMLILSGYNYRNNRNGSYPFVFYINAEMLVKGKSMSTNTTNPEALNDYCFFCWEPTTGMDGKKTASYYLEEFFKPTKEEIAAYEAEKKAREERAAREREERMKRIHLARNECINAIKSEIDSGKTMSEQLLKNNHCEIKHYNILYKKDGLDVQIGALSEPSIKYIGGKEHLLDLLGICGSSGTLVFNTHNNQTQNNLISDLFKFQAKCAVIGFEDKAYYFFDHSFAVSTQFRVTSTDEFNGIKVKVSEKKGELIYAISVPWDEKTCPNFLKKEEILKRLKPLMPTKGKYKFNLYKSDGKFAITSSGKNICEDIPCTRIIIVKDAKACEGELKYYACE